MASTARAFLVSAPALVVATCAFLSSFGCAEDAGKKNVDQVVIEDWQRMQLGSKGRPSGWQGQNWGVPAYDMTVIDDGGRRALHLKSVNESSTIAKDVQGRVKLQETPILEWTWKATLLPKQGDARRKETDDQVAQVYVVWPRFPSAVRSRIIGYIWDSTAPVDAVFPSQKVGTVTFVVVRSGSSRLGEWIIEQRNLKDDYMKIYGEAPMDPGAIALTIDTNDTRSTAESFVGRIVFRR